MKEICDTLARGEYKSSTLVLEVVKSYPFRYRRNATSAPAAAPGGFGGNKGGKDAGGEAAGDEESNESGTED